MQTQTYHKQASPAIDIFQQHHLRVLGHIADNRLPRPSPPHLELERSPSQPSLTNSNTTDTSEEHATTPRAPVHHMTSAVVSKRSLDGFAHLAAKEFYEDDDKHSFTRDDSSTFTDRRTKRLSLSRSLQNLREKADQSRRRSSVSSSK